MITEFSDYSEKIPIDRIERACLDNVCCLGDGWGTETINFIDDDVFLARFDAKKRLEAIQADISEGFAVRYLVYDNREVRADPDVAAVQGDVDGLESTINAYKAHVLPWKTTPGRYIDCPKCKSRLSAAHMGKRKMYICPLCHADLRPEDDLAKIASLEDMLSKKKEELEEVKAEAMRDMTSVGRNWLVMYKIAEKEDHEN